MQYRKLGKTGLDVSILGYGASPLGSVFRNIDESVGVQTVYTAIDLGINFIDVSPYYGLTRAETVLGMALKDISRDAYYLATKVGRYGDLEFDFTADRVIRSVDESLARLQVEHIDLIQCHDIEFGSLEQIVNETLPALETLREQGKVRFIGITGLPLTIFRYVLDRTQVDTVLSYCHYALNDTALMGLLPYLQAQGVGVINGSPFSMRLLTAQGPPDWHPAPHDIRLACQKAMAYCQSKGGDIAQLAMQFSVANEHIATTLVGTANPENLKKNVAWALAELDRELLLDVQEILAPIHNKTWPSGLPENQ